MNMTLGHFQLLSYTSVYSLVMLTLKLVLQCLIQEKYQLAPVKFKTNSHLYRQYVRQERGYLQSLWKMKTH